ncbi:hypothetical protein [Cellulophaga sp. Hel_I_12]|uniref:hypothetical protein n=1 Tax=Cellulophaga sp. Hel_I_12 TaxID=1249972 RepID=UPI00068D4631|nr:hypothetical protein [Cellulophaga sp. Hel_I_12]
MPRISLTFIFILLFLLSANAQNQQEYLGVLKLNDSSFISYRLNFEIMKDNSLKGYSVTNMGGAHETKSYLVGKYDPTDNSIFFKEEGVEYTKSDVKMFDFCYVHFKGTLKKITGQDRLEGPFFGKYSDGVSCIDGEIKLKNFDQIEKIAEIADKKIQKSKKINDSIKENISVSKTLTLSGLNVLKASETTTLFTKSSIIKLHIWDAGKLDGDKISIFFNDESLLNSHVISKEKKSISLNLMKGENILKIRAENLGAIAPNTAKIEVYDGFKNIDLLSNLKKGELTTILIIN